MWNPDVLLASGYNDVLRHPSFETHVLPEMTGGVFNFYADAHRTSPSSRERGARARLPRRPAGAARDGADAAVGGARPDAARRADGGAPAPAGGGGRQLAPGSGVACPDPAEPGACEDGHVEGVLWRDIRCVDRTPPLPVWRRARPRAHALLASRPVRPSGRPQRNVASPCAAGAGSPRSRSGVAGANRSCSCARATAAAPGRVRCGPSRGRAGGADEWWPAWPSAHRGRVTVAWIDDSSGASAPGSPAPPNGGAGFGPARRWTPTPPGEAAQWKPALAQGRGDRGARRVHRRARARPGPPAAGGRLVRADRERRPERATRLDTGEAGAARHQVRQLVGAERRQPRQARAGHLARLPELRLGRLLARLDQPRDELQDQQLVNDTPDGDEELADTPRAAARKDAGARRVDRLAQARLERDEAAPDVRHLPLGAREEERAGRPVRDAPALHVRA